MDHKQWLKDYKDCKYKLMDGARTSTYPITPGHWWCGLSFPLAHRCMYRKCELLKEAQHG